MISINSTGATAMTAANATGTTYDGGTVLLSAATPVAAGANSLYLSIFDQGDGDLGLGRVRRQRSIPDGFERRDGLRGWGTQAPSGDDQLIDTQTTGADGTALFTGLQPGTYWLDETEAPDGCEIVTEVDQGRAHRGGHRRRRAEGGGGRERLHA